MRPFFIFLLLTLSLTPFLVRADDTSETYHQSTCATAAPTLLNAMRKGDIPWPTNKFTHSDWIDWARGAVCFPLGTPEDRIVGLINPLCNNALLVRFDDAGQPVNFGYKYFFDIAEHAKGPLRTLLPVFDNYTSMRLRIQDAAINKKDLLFKRHPSSVDTMLNPTNLSSGARDTGYPLTVRQRILANKTLQQLLQGKLTATELKKDGAVEDYDYKVITKVFGDQPIDFKNAEILWQIEENIEHLKYKNITQMRQAILYDPNRYPALMTLMTMQVADDGTEQVGFEFICFTGDCVPERI